MTFAEVISNLSKMKEYHVCIYGCGRNGEAAVNCLNYAGIRIDAICDRQIGIEICGMKAISLDRLLQLDSQMICIVTPATGVGEEFEKLNRHFDTVLGMETIYWMERYIPVLDHMWNWNCYAPFNSYDSPYINSNSMEYDLYDEDKCDRPSGIDFNDESQIALLKEMSPFYNEFYDDLEKGRFQRYKLNNGYFDEGDAALYYGILRKFTPEHIIEIGSGFSTALALDVKENYMENMELSCVEPYPDRLFQNIKKDDKLQIFKEYVQKMELKFFDTLNAGDILFIDSSHVAKLGGDIPYEYFEILPRLKKGVIIHIHDIFYPFVYPKRWIREGRCYNESFVLRALLMDNKNYEILIFNDMLAKLCSSEFYKVCKSSGGSIWLRKI